MSRVQSSLLSGVAGLLLAGDAWAACPAPYTTDSLLADLTATEKAVRDRSAGDAGAGAGKLEAGLPCLDVPLPRPIAGKAYRAIGGGYVVAGDAKGKGWLVTAAELEPTFAYGVEDLAADHPVRDAYTAAKASSSGEEVVGGPVPAGTEVYVDGRKMTTDLKAKAGRPHVVQQKGASGVTGWLVDGATFPTELVPAGSSGTRPKDGDVATAKPPKGEKPPKEAKAPKPPKNGGSTTGGVTMIDRKRPWEKTPLLLGGTAVVLGGGAVYGLSYLARQKFEGATTKADLDLYHSRTNTYFIAALAVTGVGVGTLTWGAILSDSGPVAGLQFEF